MVARNAVVFLLLGFLSAMFEPMVSPYLRTELKWSTDRIGLYYLIVYPSSFIFSLLIPYLADRTRRDKIAMIATIFFAFCTYLGFYFFRGFWQTLFIAFVFLGPAASLSPQLFGYVARLRNGVVSAVVLRGIFSFAWVAGPTLAATIVVYFGFDGLFLALAALSMALLAIVLTLDAAPGGRSAGKSRVFQRQDLSVFFAMFLAFALLQGGNAVALMALPIIVTEQLGHPISTVGYVFALCALLEVPLFLGLSRLMAKLDILNILLFGTLIGISYYLVILNTDSLYVILSAQVLNAAFVATVFGAGMAWFQSSIPKMPGFATGLFANSYRIGAVSLVPAGALVAGRMNNDFRASLLLATAATVVALFLLAVPTVGRKRKLADQTRTSREAS